MSENTNHQYSMVGIFMLKIGERMKIKDMERLTHKRENGIKRGYWSPNKKQELVDRLAMYEDIEDAKDTNVLGKWIPCSEKLPEDESYILVSFENATMLDIARYEENDEGGTFYPGDDEKSYSSYGIFVNAWMDLPEPYRQNDEGAEK